MGARKNNKQEGDFPGVSTQLFLRTCSRIVFAVVSSFPFRYAPHQVFIFFIFWDPPLKGSPAVINNASKDTDLQFVSGEASQYICDLLPCL